MPDPLGLLRRLQSKWLVVFGGLFRFRPIFFGGEIVNYLGQDNSWRLYRGTFNFCWITRRVADVSNSQLG
jgi:hypothetical protein